MEQDISCFRLYFLPDEYKSQKCFKMEPEDIPLWECGKTAFGDIEVGDVYARAIFHNMGVALPNGDMKEVYETIKTDDYMGWKRCTMQEAQQAADTGIAAIGISGDRLVVLSAADEEEPAAQTASVMTLSENTPAYAVSDLAYYSYSYGATYIFPDTKRSSWNSSTLNEDVANVGRYYFY